MPAASKDPVDDVRIISVPAIIAIIGAVVGAIGSLAASAVLVIGALKETTKAVETAAVTAKAVAETATAEAKLQDAAIKEVHILTNNNLAEVRSRLDAAMEELKKSREDLAILAGRQAERDDQAVEDAVTDKDP